MHPEISIEQFVTNVLHIQSTPAVKKLVNCGNIVHLKEKEILFLQGYVPEHVAFLLNGIMRSFVIVDKGADVTECFDFQYGWPVVPSIPLNAPASVNIEASVESDLILFPTKDVWKLIETNIDVSHMYNLLLCQSMAKYVQFTRVMMTCSAEQKYQWFCKEYAAVNGKVSNKEVASFLNITPGTLSRTRQRMNL